VDHIIRSAMLLATLPTFFSFSAGWATFEAIFRASNQSLGRPVPTAMIGWIGISGGIAARGRRFVFSRVVCPGS